MQGIYHCPGAVDEGRQRERDRKVGYIHAPTVSNGGGTPSRAREGCVVSCLSNRELYSPLGRLLPHSPPTKNILRLHYTHTHIYPTDTSPIRFGHCRLSPCVCTLRTRADAFLSVIRRSVRRGRCLETSNGGHRRKMPGWPVAAGIRSKRDSEKKIVKEVRQKSFIGAPTSCSHDRRPSLSHRSRTPVLCRTNIGVLYPVEDGRYTSATEHVPKLTCAFFKRAITRVDTVYWLHMYSQWQSYGERAFNAYRVNSAQESLP